MYAIEFTTTVRNGTIQIPVKYRDKLRDMVRVIILADKHEKNGDLIDQLLESPLKVKGFKPLSRDEIYA